jgi:hypothetical protein
VGAREATLPHAGRPFGIVRGVVTPVVAAAGAVPVAIAGAVATAGAVVVAGAAAVGVAVDAGSAVTRVAPELQAVIDIAPATARSGRAIGRVRTLFMANTPPAVGRASRGEVLHVRIYAQEMR